MSDELVGTRFGPYRIDGLIGRGGMGAVYRAYDTVRDREVALKLLGGSGADDGTFAERFRRECHLVAKLGEPHIIPIHDYGQIDGRLYLDMRLVDGENLRQVLRREGALPPEKAIDIVSQVGDALDAAHVAGLVHRDVKPENILLTPTGFAYLVDFGIAHDDADPGLTKTGTAIGSTSYLAPEQFDNAPVSPASDVYSLSAVLFELLTGRAPFYGESVSAIIKAAVLNDVPAPSTVNPAVPASLDPVLACGLAKSPAQRFATAGDLGRAAKQALSGGGVTVVMPTGVIPGPTEVHATGPEAGAAYSATQLRASGPQPLGPQVSGPQVTGPYGAPPMYSGPIGYQQPPESGRATNYVLAGLIGLLIAVLAGLGIAWGLGVFGGGGDDSSAAPSSTTTLTSTVTPDGATTVAAPPSWSTPCSSTEGIGSGVTSCEFAASVRAAYLAAGPKGGARVISAYSPVTGVNYTMSCGPEGGIVVCRGGNNAIVHIY
ncbi:serine/threonine-protein kinase [Gordonia sp. FQ]|uniref:serine/threonine-protein kinase n=1 Tax=Gordonia sp. FQ TaxID=3446634 RepID=UPI003F834468